METNINQNYRISTSVETAIFNKARNLTRAVYIEIFIVFSILGITLLFLSFVAFDKNAFMGGLIFLLFIVIVILNISFWKTIKTSKEINSYKIYADEGKWEFKLEGHGKSAQLVSRANGIKTGMILAEFYETPKVNEPKYIKYEYVHIFDRPPLFGYGRIFASINGHKLTNRHRTVFELIKPINLLSIIGSVIFPISLIFNFGIKFNPPEFIIVSIVSFFIFFRSIKIWRNNKKLTKNFNKTI